MSKVEGAVNIDGKMYLFVLPHITSVSLIIQIGNGVGSTELSFGEFKKVMDVLKKAEEKIIDTIDKMVLSAYVGHKPELVCEKAFSDFEAAKKMEEYLRDVVNILGYVEVKEVE